MRAHHRGIGAVLALVLLAACTGTQGDDEDAEPGTTTTTTLPASTTTSETPAEPTLAAAAVEVQEIADLDEPIALTPRAGTPNLYVAEKRGVVRVIEVTTSGTSDVPIYRVARSPLLDLSESVINEGERGLLGMAFSTDGRRLYLDYTAEPDGRTVVVEYSLDDRGAIARDSRRVLLEVEQPYANHNGGHLLIGRDGYLYIGLGDGGDSGDPHGNGQDPTTLLGSILRIDPAQPSGDRPYAIPAGNPFADGEQGAPEVWLYGVRNPWRFSFDPANGDLWVADVGQNAWEEITWLPSTAGFDAGRGANLGWDRLEGTHEFDGPNPEDGVLPIFEYSHEGGACSITGGVMYRGDAIPALQGTYLFADFCSTGLWAIQARDGQVVAERAWPELPLTQVQSFGTDEDGEVFALLAGGPVLKLRPGR